MLSFQLAPALLHHKMRPDPVRDLIRVYILLLYNRIYDLAPFVAFYIVDVEYVVIGVPFMAGALDNAQRAWS